MSKITFRVVSDPKAGYYQLYRCLALASGLKETDSSLEIVFLTNCQSACAQLITNSGYMHVDPGQLSMISWDLETTENYIEEHGTDILIIDNPLINEHYLSSLKEKVSLLVVIDDFMTLKIYDAHVVVNPNLYGHLLDYQYNNSTELLLGTEFSLLSSEFDKYQEFRHDTLDKAKHILIYFRGSDPKNASLLAVKALKIIQGSFSAAIITGGDFEMGEELAREIGLDSRFIVLQESDIAKRLASSDLAITNQTIFCELLLLKIPTVLICDNDKHTMIADYAGKNGLALSLGSVESLDLPSSVKLLNNLICDKSERERMAARMEDLVDGLGRFRLADEILRIYKAKKIIALNQSTQKELTNI